MRSAGFLRRAFSGLPKFRATSRLQHTEARSHQRLQAGVPFWNSGHVLGFTGVTASLAYFYGHANQDEKGSVSQWLQKRRPKYGRKEDMQKAIQELREDLGEDTISTDDEDLLRHGFSEWSSINVDQLPVAVAYPKSTEEVSRIAKICHKFKVPMVPYSGGSSLEANYSAPYGGMSIDFTHMDQILSLHAEDMDVIVQPSVSWMELNDKIKHSGLFFPVDPGPSARIGGMVGTSCSGTNAVRYGTMKDWVINLTVVLADGTVIKTRRRPRWVFLFWPKQRPLTIQTGSHRQAIISPTCL